MNAKLTEILKIKGDWQEVVDDCRATVAKPPLGKEPSTAFKKRILLSEHSTIRDIHIKWSWRQIKSWVATHWSRHKFEKFIQTQRTDRTGVNRDELPQSAIVTFTGDANIQNLIDAMRKRLCFQASDETREYAEDLKISIHGVEPEIADVFVLNCVYRCGCPEKGVGKKCEWFEAMLKQYPDFASTDLQTRYDAYNRWFRERHNG